MRIAQILIHKNLLNIGIIFLVIIISIAIGFSALISSTPFTPLLIIGGVFVVALFVFLLTKPTWALYLAVLAIFLPTEVLHDILPHNFLFNYLVTIIIFFTGISWLINLIIYKRKIIWKIPVILTIVFTIWSVITLFWASDISLGFETLATIIIGTLLFILLVNQIVTTAKLNGLMTTLAVVGWVLAISGVITVLTNGYVPGSRLTVLKINENTYGMLLLVTMPGVLWQSTRNNNRRILPRLLSITYIILMVSLIGMSGSRGSAISAVVTLLAFLFWKATRKWGMIGLSIIIVGIILAPILFSTVVDRFSITEGDTLLGGREALWQGTWNLILDHPIQGVGIGNSRLALIPYVIILRSIGSSESVAAHNPVLQVWADTGFFGIILYMGILVSAIIQFIHQYVGRRKYYSQAIISYFAIISSTFLGYILSWVKGGGTEFTYTYFLLLSLIVVASNQDLVEDRSNSQANKLV